MFFVSEHEFDCDLFFVSVAYQLLPVRFQTNAIKVLMRKASIWDSVGLAAAVRFKEQLGGVESESVKQ